MKSGAAPTLTASKTTLVLDQANADNEAVVFSWNAVDYGFKDALQYSLQISKAGTNFASASTTEVGVDKASLKKAFTVRALNQELNKILKTGVPSDVEVRLKSDYGNILSNVVKLTVTPYRELVTYSYPQALNVAGSYQGWDPGTAPQLVSMANDGKYEGFIDMSSDANPMFKLVKGNKWDAGDYGAGASAGTIASPSGNNLTITTGAGIYLLKANTTANTWSADKINNWSIIGDAPVASANWTNDITMTYDPATKVYTATTDFGAGKFKFRANHAWDINLGDKSNDGKPDLGGDDIPVTTPGNYTVTLDVSVGGNWVYSLKKN
jgi:hypothetical protein